MTGNRTDVVMCSWGGWLRSRPYLVLRPDTAIPAGIPADVLPSGWRMVEDTSVNVRLLRLSGLQVSSPLSRRFDFPGATPNMPQRATAEFLTMNPRAFVFNGMGTGKTLATIWAWLALRRDGAARRLLVIAPLSVLVRVWATESMRADHGLKVLILRHQDPAKRRAMLAAEHDICVVNPATAVRMVPDLLARGYDTLVLDEASAYRDARSSRSKEVGKLAKAARRVWALTATPTPRAPSDGYGLLRMVMPESPHAKSFVRFRDMVETRRGPYRYEPRPDAQATLASLLRPAVRYTLSDVMKVPQVEYNYTRCKLSPRQEKIYEEMRLRAVAMQGDVLARNSGVVMRKLVQIAGGVVIDKDGNPVRIVPTESDDRLATAEQLVRATEKNAIVFVPYRAMLEDVASALSKAFDNERAVDVVHGGVGLARRNEIFQRFMDESPFAPRKVIVAEPATMSHGLTLTTANLIVWYLPIDDYEVYEQANGRIVRLGQKASCFIEHIVASRREETVYKMLKQKESGQNMLLSLLQKDG